jgi:cystathionine beta-lyase/cystathionine gamma-synthase
MDHSATGFATRAIHVGQDPDVATGATIVPIYATSTFTQAAPGNHKGYEYARGKNPTRRALEQCLAALDGAEEAVAFGSGMAAEAAVLTAFLRPGDEIVGPADLYGGTFRILERVYKPWGLVPKYAENTSPADFAALIGPKTKMIWLESPTNPLLQIIDIAAVADIARRAGAMLVVDNTFASPYLQQPLALGADLVVYSTTKYHGGHSDVVGGAVATRADLAKELRFHANASGGVPGPFDAYLVMRGVKTLALRMERHCQNAKALAVWLAEHPRVKQVYYPGLPQHPGHDIAQRQMRDFGGMMSLRVHGGKEETLKFITSTRLFSLAESLGGVESLINHPATMTHASIPAEVRLKRGVDDTLVRLSVGIEDLDDLKRDLDQALRRE